MKISKNQMFINFRKWCFGIVSVMLFAGSFNANAQGEALFKAKCASCHQPLKDGTGPKLSQVRTKWADGGAKEGSIYQWVKNWQAAAASDPYAKGVESWSPTAMTSAPDLTDDQITEIFNWVDAQVEVVAPAEGDAPVVGEEVVEEESTTWLWVLMGVIFTTIILAVGGVRRQLKHVTADAKGETIGVVEDYQPSQPIEFPHTIHAGKNGIDCKYCHNSVTKSKSAGLPTVNVCMNCHKQIAW
jgi:cytochrome c551/c552